MSLSKYLLKNIIEYFTKSAELKSTLFSKNVLSMFLKRGNWQDSLQAFPLRDVVSAKYLCQRL